MYLFIISLKIGGHAKLVGKQYITAGKFPQLPLEPEKTSFSPSKCVCMILERKNEVPLKVLYFPSTNRLYGKIIETNAFAPQSVSLLFFFFFCLYRHTVLMIRSPWCV